MKKNVIFLTFTLLFCYFCFASICAVAGVTAKVKPDFDENDLPQANPDMNFNFTIEEFNILDTTQYYTIRVKLTSSNFKGYAANAGDSLENDLYFEEKDNHKHKWEVSPDGTTLTYAYSSTNTDIPKKIKVRCRDYGAHGSIQITANNVNVDIIKDDNEDDPLHIPIDVNGNDIADGWEKKNGIYVADKTEAIKKAAADDERGPINAILIDAEGNPAKRTCVNDGDGWSVYDEYRGLFTTFGQNKPAGHECLDPKIKNIMYTSHTNVADHGTGALPSIAIHSFMHVDHRLYQKEIINGVEALIDPFTDIYVYDKKTGKASHTANVDSRIGRVNYNSNPGGGALSVPGAKSVWSIRIKDEGTDNHADKARIRMGNATPGSPCKYSLAVIFTGNIDAYLERFWKGQVAPQVKQAVKDAKATHIAAAKKKLIPKAIGHEVGHCLNIHPHCNNPNCIMNEDTKFDFFQDGSFDIIKRGYNDEGDIDDVTDNDGFPVILDLDDIILSHITNLAVTGQPGRHNNIDNHYIEIGFVSYEDDESDDNEVGQSPSQDPTSSQSLSFAPSDGLYTAVAGDLHTAQVSAPEEIYSVTWYVASPGDTGRGSHVNVGSGIGDGIGVKLRKLRRSYESL